MLKQGYLLEVTTWENDGDYYQTKQLSGLTKNQVTFLVTLMEYFKLGTNTPSRYAFGNSGLKDTPDSGASYYQFIEAMDKLRNYYVTEFDQFFKHPDDQTKLWHDIKADLFNGGSDVAFELCRYYHDTLTKILLGDAVNSNEDCFFRVVETVKVAYIPENIEYLPLEAFIHLHQQ